MNPDAFSFLKLDFGRMSRSDDGDRVASLDETLAEESSVKVHSPLDAMPVVHS